MINTAAPSRISTDRVSQLDAARAEKEGTLRENIEAEMAAQIPLGRYGQPHEFAKICTFLLSEANTYITGQTILVDGGSVKSI